MPTMLVSRRTMRLQSLPTVPKAASANSASELRPERNEREDQYSERNGYTAGGADDRGSIHEHEPDCNARIER